MQAYDPDSHTPREIRKFFAPAQKSTAQDIAAWRAARRKRRRDAQETRDLAAARALLDIAGQLDPLVRMPFVGVDPGEADTTAVLWRSATADEILADLHKELERCR